MTAQDILIKYWKYPNFRPLQLDIINSALAGSDNLALLPTGGGKSVCFQIPALMKEGICIVISPLIALMKDQVEQLKERGINAVAIYSGMGKREIDILLDNCIYGNIKFLYLSPERLLSEIVRVRISYMNVNFIAVDEAHCISQWGYDFRPPYQQISELRVILPKVPIIALTATATEFVRKDICDKLTLQNPNVFIKSFARENISYSVFNQDDKFKKLIDVCNNVKGTGLVYVRNRRETAEVANFLKRNGINADFYHAGLERNERFSKQEAWKNDRIRVIVATNAFGMGIDKAAVRFVVHMDLPESLEAYYQEAGRAGRDEQKAYAVLLANKADVESLETRYIESFPLADDIRKTYHYLGNYYQLAFGSGEGLTFSFNIIDFCKRFNLNALKTISALKFLEHDGYITLTESVFLPSRLMITAAHEDLYRFQIEQKSFDSLIKVILRSYGGAFDGFVKIDESDIAKKANFSFNQVKQALEKLNEVEIISYMPQTDEPQLSYVRPRVDLDHFDVDVKYLNQRKTLISSQVNSVISYCTSTQCRSVMLLNYFNENNAEKCGYCDICIDEKRKSKNLNLEESIEEQILNLLKQQALDLTALINAVNIGSEKDKLKTIRNLLDAGLIKTSGTLYTVN